MQNTFSQSGNDSKWFLKKSFFKIGKWHSRPPRDPPPLHGKCHLKFPFWFFETFPKQEYFSKSYILHLFADLEVPGVQEPADPAQFTKGPRNSHPHYSWRALLWTGPFKLMRSALNLSLDDHKKTMFFTILNFFNSNLLLHIRLDHISIANWVEHLLFNRLASVWATPLCITTAYLTRLAELTPVVSLEVT